MSETAYLTWGSARSTCLSLIWYRNRDNLILTAPKTADEKNMRSIQERRTTNRLLCAELVEAIWTDHRGVKQRRIANLEDISLSGVCLQLESAILPGTQMAINYGDGRLVGAVRYCIFRDGGHFLGIQLAEGCKWSSKHFRPRHLIDPEKLVASVLARHQKSTGFHEHNKPALSS